MTIHKQSSPSVVFSAIATSCLSVAIGIMAVFGNLTFLYIVYSVRRLRRAYFYLLVCLAVTDLCIGLFSIPVYFSQGILRAHQRFSHYLGDAEQVLYILLFGMSLVGVLNLTLDRLLAVMFPLKRKSWNLKTVYAILYSSMLCLTLVSIILWSREIVRLNRLRAVIGVLVGIILLAILLSYAQMYRMIKASDRAREEITLQISPKKKKSLFTSGYISILVVLLYLPRAFVATIKHEESLYHYMRWTSLLIFSNSAVNPAIYYFQKEEIQTELLRIVRGFRGWIFSSNVVKPSMSTTETQSY